MDGIDVVLSALSDPTRRQVIERLADGPCRTNELAEAVGVSVPAVSRHLRVLRERDVVERVDVEGDGRGREYRLNPASLSTIATWLRGDYWTTQLPAASPTPDADEYLARVGGFLDGFAHSDVSFFERHLAADAELIFPGSSARWDKASTVASVPGHAPYVEWNISDTTVSALGAHLVLVVATVDVRTSAAAETASVVQSMIFDDERDPWTLRFLQQTPTT